MTNNTKAVVQDHTVDTGTVYKTALDGNSEISKQIAWAFQCYAQDTPDMTVQVAAGAIQNGRTLTSKAAQNTGTITAPSVNPRIDRVVIDSLGVVSVITGAEAGSPSAPAITPDQVSVAQILLATTDTEIVNSQITDERPGLVRPFGWTLLDEQIASSDATLDFTTGIDSVYDHYKFTLLNVLPATDGQNLKIQVSTDGGSTWKSGAADYEINRVDQKSDTAGVAAASNSQGTTAITIANPVGNVAGEGVSGELRFRRIEGGDGHSYFRGEVEYFDNTATAIFIGTMIVGVYNGALDNIEGVRFLFGSGNIASGTIALYGLRK